MLPRIYDGTGQPMPERLQLRAGPVTLVYEAGTLRYIRCGGVELVRQIYAAVRDHNWGTIPGALTLLEQTITPQTFTLRYTSVHRQQDIHFVWQGTIQGDAAGTLTFDFAGTAHSAFRRNRIGFCVLHPMTCAGLPCVIEQVDGQQVAGVFPEQIAPHQPFKGIRAITYDAAPGLRVAVRLEGDTFEMEDQRNWIDASYKTYCTPLELPFPVEIAAGTRIEQRITVRLLALPAASTTTAAPLRLELQPARRVPLPPLGLGAASDGAPLDALETERLRALNLAHLRVDVRPDDAGAAVYFRQVCDEARALGLPLEIALHLTPAAEEELQRVAAWRAELKPAVARWLIFYQQEKSTSARWLALARAALGAGGAPLVAGTDAFFTELNRQRPPLAACDAVVYSLNPQVHAFDNASLTETLPVMAVTVASARAFAPGKPVHVSPVTLKMRWNPNATGAAPTPPPGTLPERVDVRQMALFGAGWTLGSLKYLALGGAASITYYETTGWLGVMERAAGAPLPERFASQAGAVFPLYHVLAEVGIWAGGEVIDCAASDPLTVDGMALMHAGRLALLLYNATHQPQTVTLAGIAGVFALRLLDATTAEQTAQAPESWLATPGERCTVVQGTLELHLPPYALAVLRQEAL